VGLSRVFVSSCLGGESGSVVAAMWFPFFRRKDPAAGGTMREMPPAVRELAEPWESLTGSIAGLTVEIEREFRFGQSVISLDGRYRMGGNLKGGSSAMWIPAERSAFYAYLEWRDRHGMPRVKDRRAFKRLNRFLSSRGVRLINGSWSGEEQESRNFSEKRGYLYALTLEILTRLPESHVRRPQFRVLQIGGWGPDGAKASAYENGSVMMYDFAVNGARRTYAGLLLHELGHAQEEAFGPEACARLEESYREIARSGQVIGVEFLLDAKARKLYQLRALGEFLAETYLVYTSQGGGLRRFVAGLDGAARKSWEAVYDTFRGAFEGVEYR
jgi:hypothetical protein